MGFGAMGRGGPAECTGVGQTMASKLALQLLGGVGTDPEGPWDPSLEAVKGPPGWATGVGPESELTARSCCHSDTRQPWGRLGDPSPSFTGGFSSGAEARTGAAAGGSRALTLSSPVAVLWCRLGPPPHSGILVSGSLQPGRDLGLGVYGGGGR